MRVGFAISAMTALSTLLPFDLRAARVEDAAGYENIKGVLSSIGNGYFGAAHVFEGSGQELLTFTLGARTSSPDGWYIAVSKLAEEPFVEDYAFGKADHKLVASIPAQGTYVIMLVAKVAGRYSATLVRSPIASAPLEDRALTGDRLAQAELGRVLYAQGRISEALPLLKATIDWQDATMLTALAQALSVSADTVELRMTLDVTRQIYELAGTASDFKDADRFALSAESQLLGVGPGPTHVPHHIRWKIGDAHEFDIRLIKDNSWRLEMRADKNKIRADLEANRWQYVADVPRLLLTAPHGDGATFIPSLEGRETACVYSRKHAGDNWVPLVRIRAAGKDRAEAATADIVCPAVDVLGRTAVEPN